MENSGVPAFGPVEQRRLFVSQAGSSVNPQVEYWRLPGVSCSAGLEGVGKKVMPMNTLVDWTEKRVARSSLFQTVEPIG